MNKLKKYKKKKKMWHKVFYLSLLTFGVSSLLWVLSGIYFRTIAVKNAVISDTNCATMLSDMHSYNQIDAIISNFIPHVIILALLTWIISLTIFLAYKIKLSKLKKRLD